MMASVMVYMLNGHTVMQELPCTGVEPVDTLSVLGD